MPALALRAQAPATGTPAYSVPSQVQSIPGGPLGDAVRYGEQLVTETPVYAKRYVGNGLTCTNCHLDGGRTPYVAPWVGIWGVFPEYSVRRAKVETLADRINDCFRRSMNGKAVPVDSKEMLAMLAYMQWLSTGVPTGTDGPGRGFRRIKLPDGTRADPANGQALFAQKCVMCHGTNGQGVLGTDGQYVFPPLWGDKSFNNGAGMARLDTAAAFIKVAMPLGQGGTLTDQEAFDIAAYVTSRPRPKYAGR